MFLGNPSFPISFQLEKVTELIEKTLREKHWRDFKVAEVKLVLTPLFVFQYDAAFEKKGEAGKGVVGETKNGRLALDAISGELDKALAESMPAESELAKELPDTYPIEAREAELSKNEAREIAIMKTASMLGTSRNNVVLSRFRMVHYPIWVAGVTVGKATYELEISAVTGEVFGEEKVPEREKGFVEITQETLEELKQPGAWVKYSKEVVGTAAEKLSGGKKGAEQVKVAKGRIRLPSVLHRPGFWLSIALVIVLILAVLYL